MPVLQEKWSVKHDLMAACHAMTASQPEVVAKVIPQVEMCTFRWPTKARDRVRPSVVIVTVTM